MFLIFTHLLETRLEVKKTLENLPKIHIKLIFVIKKKAIKESLEDQYEGADILMVKPAMYYLDIINELKKKHFAQSPHTKLVVNIA